MREQVDELVRRRDAGPVTGFGAAWIASAPSRLRLFFRGRRPGVVVRAGDDLLVVRRHRRALEARDVVADIPLERATLRRSRRLGPLRQVVVDDPHDGTTYALEFPRRSRRFATAIATALAR